MKNLMLGVAALCAASVMFCGPALAETANKPIDVRVEINGGANWGDPHLSINGAEGDLDVGTGFSVGAQLWVDRVGFDYLSLGAQYLYLRQGEFSASGTVSAPGVTGTGSVSIRPSYHTFFANAALRYPEGSINPYIGGGIGVAVSKLSADLSGTGTINGQAFAANGSDSDSSTNFAGQVFGGVDITIADNIYLGVSGRYILTNFEAVRHRHGIAHLLGDGDARLPLLGQPQLRKSRFRLEGGRGAASLFLPRAVVRDRRVGDQYLGLGIVGAAAMLGRTPARHRVAIDAAMGTTVVVADVARFGAETARPVALLPRRDRPAGHGREALRVDATRRPDCPRHEVGLGAQGEAHAAPGRASAARSASKARFSSGSGSRQSKPWRRAAAARLRPVLR